VVTINDSNTKSNFVAYGTCKDATLEGKPKFTIEGKDGSNRALTIDLNNVDSVEIREMEPSRLLLRVTVFPAITPSELLSKQPTYTGLREGFTATHEAWVLADETQQRGPCIVQRELETEKYLAFLDLRKQKIGTRVNFSYQTKAAKSSIWWAIPSVVQDPEYPYRDTVVLKK
jgi:hypothetical protein